MINSILQKQIVISVFVLLIITSFIYAEESPLPHPSHIQISESLSSDDAQKLLAVAQKYYAFWSTGKEKYAREALSPNFIDLNLPPNRPQGVEGPIQASKNFRKAVPNLKLRVEDVYILKNKVIGRLHFYGDFTGVFGDTKGKGQKISFYAVDMYTIQDGVITENWHLEDYLTLLKQMEVVD